MSKYSSDRRFEAPSGYETVWLSDQTRFILPTDISRDVREAAWQRKQNETAQRIADQDREIIEFQQNDTDAGEEDRSDEIVRFEEAPRAGWYRVLPCLTELERQVDDAFAMNKSADKEVNDRRTRIIGELLKRGPDRKVQISHRWRTAFDELEHSLPHFRKPIKTLRNALAMAEATGLPPRIPPQLLLGPPGVGKTFFCHRVAEILGTTHGSVHFDQPGAGSQLRGADKYWANSEAGLLFNLVCMGDAANPLVLLDEIDKVTDGHGHRSINQLAQLHGALERETARCIRDISLDVEFDASLVTYVATANSLDGLDPPLLSRMDVSVIEAPNRNDSFAIAWSIAHGVLRENGLDDALMFDKGAIAVLSVYSPRIMQRTAEKAISAAVEAGRSKIGEVELWAQLDDDATQLH